MLLKGAWTGLWRKCPLQVTSCDRDVQPPSFRNRLPHMVPLGIWWVSMEYRKQDELDLVCGCKCGIMVGRYSWHVDHPKALACQDNYIMFKFHFIFPSLPTDKMICSGIRVVSHLSGVFLKQIKERFERGKIQNSNAQDSYCIVMGSTA